MDPRSGPGNLRWDGLGGTGRFDAGFGRLLPVPANDLRSGPARAPAIISLHLAVDLQRSAFDCLRLHWFVSLCQLPVAAASRYVSCAQVERAGASPGLP